jgi:nitrate reductase delta subunit
MAVYSLFAEILDYPERLITKLAADCIAELSAEFPEASSELRIFQSETVDKTLGQLQETYANAFDLRPDCTPNLGYHLFGDDGRRGLFLAELKGRMEARGISQGSELPDHLSLLLRYMDAAEEDRAPLVMDCLLPAVTRMLQVLEGCGNPYEHALRALLTLLREQTETLKLSMEAQA